MSKRKKALICVSCGYYTYGRQCDDSEDGYGLCNDCAQQYYTEDNATKLAGIKGYHRGIISKGDKS